MLHDTLWCPGLRLAEAPILPVWIEPQALCSALGVQQEHSHSLPGDTRPSDPMPTSSDFGEGGGLHL